MRHVAAIGSIAAKKMHQRLVRAEAALDLDLRNENEDEEAAPDV